MSSYNSRLQKLEQGNQPPQQIYIGYPGQAELTGPDGVKITRAELAELEKRNPNIVLLQIVHDR